jgi:hypothetical protein
MPLLITLSHIIFKKQRQYHTAVTMAVKRVLNMAVREPQMPLGIVFDPVAVSKGTATARIRPKERLPSCRVLRQTAYVRQKIDCRDCNLFRVRQKNHEETSR